MNEKRLAHFKFTLYDDYEFNHEILIDIIYLESNKLTLYVIDSATAFNVARFLPEISTAYI